MFSWPDKAEFLLEEHGVGAMEFQLRYFKALKCCTQCASKFGKLSSSQRARKGQPQCKKKGERAVTQNVQTAGELHSFLMLVRLHSKSCKLGFSRQRTNNFQIYKLDLEKAEEPEIKLPISVGSERKEGNSRRHLLLLH